MVFDKVEVLVRLYRTCRICDFLTVKNRFTFTSYNTSETKRMAFKKSFLLSDESVNSYGFWIKTAGIDLTQAQKNLPAFYDHKTWETPIGHWVNLRVNDKAELWGDIVIEGANDREKEYIRKIENGDIKGASIGADPLAWNENPLQLKQGQSVPTLDQCDLFEASITPLPGNKNALALKCKEGFVTLSQNNLNIIPSLNITPDMKQIALSLGLAETATEQQITDAIKVLLSRQAAAEQQYIDTVTEGLEADEKEIFVQLHKSDPKTADKFLKLKKPATEEAPVVPATGGVTLTKDKKVSELIQRGGGQHLSKNASEAGKDTFDYLQKHNSVELKRIHSEDPERYAQLASDYGKGVRYTGK